MAQRATVQQSQDETTLAGRYVLAIEPDQDQARILEETIAGGSLKFRLFATTDAAMATFVESIPDLILVSSLLSSSDQDQIMSRLYSLGVDASDVQLLSIPLFEGTKAARKSSSRGKVGSPDAFAKAIEDHLAGATGGDTSTPSPAMPAVDVDPLDGLSAEHIEHLLGPLEADEPPESPTAEIFAFEPASKREFDMPTTTSHDLNVDSGAEPGGSRLPRFLTPDDRIPFPLRALLDEAEGCLKMSFLTGAGACSVRTLDLLLAEQGVDGTDRGEQIQQLGKKHPAVGESFITTLSLVTNNPSGAWEDARVRLALAILKAIAYEIYVLGPERSERAAYVLDLLKRFKAAGRS